MWVDNIKTGLRETEWDGTDCINLVQEWDHWRALENTGVVKKLGSS
jgi:hypothetical protein